MYYELERTGLGPVTFDGELLAFVSTASQFKPRWVELALYRTEGHRYVTAVVGQSSLPGETPRPTIRVHDTAVQAVKSFVQKRGGEISQPAIALLEEAALKDSDIDEVLDIIAEEPSKVD